MLGPRGASNTATHLVERGVGKAVSLDTLPLAESLLERSSQGQRAVLGRVVVVDVQVTLAVERERHASVLGQRGEHLRVSAGRKGMGMTLRGAAAETSPRRSRRRSPAQLTWSKNPMPVLTSMTCLVTPGMWSRSIVHVICVSPVTRSTVAVLEVLMVVVSCEAAIKSRASIKESANRGRDIWVGQRRCGQSPTPLALRPSSFSMSSPVRDFTLAITIMADTKQIAAIQAKLQQSSVAFQKIEGGAWVTQARDELTSQRWRGSSRRDRD